MRRLGAGQVDEAVVFEVRVQHNVEEAAIVGDGPAADIVDPIGREPRNLALVTRRQVDEEQPALLLRDQCRLLAQQSDAPRALQFVDDDFARRLDADDGL
ncbi:MAG: hypothetical protein AAFX58_01615 [Pseudomonadota bacterium]